jgi:hypothetical protein
MNRPETIEETRRWSTERAAAGSRSRWTISFPTRSPPSWLASPTSKGRCTSW